MPVRQAQAVMPPDEWPWWIAYNELDPIDGSADNWRAAMIARAMVGGTLEDHWPPWDKPEKPKERSGWKFWKSMCRAMAGKKHGDNSKS